MAKNDLRIPKNFDYGPFIFVTKFALLAAETFVAGEPVKLNNAGKVAESPSSPPPVEFLGIALASGDTVGATDTIGTFRQKIGQFKAGLTPNLPVAGDMIPVAVMLPGAMIESYNFATDGAGTAATPTQANAMGEKAGLVVVGGVWVIDVGVTANNEILRIIKILDANGEDAVYSGKTAIGVQAVVLSSQSSVVVDPAA